MNDDITSVPQDSWREIAAAMRMQICNRIPAMKDMTPEDMKHFIDAAQKALWLETNSECYDKHVQLEMNKITFGGDD